MEKNKVIGFTIISHNDADGLLSSVLMLRYLKNAKILFATPYSIKRIMLSLLLKLNDKAKNIQAYILDISPKQELVFLSSLFKRAIWIDHHEYEKITLKPKNVSIFWQKQESCCSVVINFLKKRSLKINDEIEFIKKIANEIDINDIKSRDAEIFRSFIGWYKLKYRGIVFNLEMQRLVKEIVKEGFVNFIKKREVIEKAEEYEKYIKEKWKEIKNKIEYKLINNIKIGYLFLNESFPVYYISNKLKEYVDVLCVCFKNKNNSMKFELRSFSHVDVSKIAKVFGGGGHKNASGGITNLTKEKFIEKIDSMLH